MPSISSTSRVIFDANNDVSPPCDVPLEAHRRFRAVFRIFNVRRRGDCSARSNIWRQSWAHDKGVPGKVVAQLTGHTDADVTINVYTQVLDASLRTAVDRIGSSRLFTNRKRGRS